jgi:hypothetical protein
MSHATARPRQAGTSFESQATSAAGSGYENQPNRDLSTLRPRLTTIPARPAAPTHNWADIACHCDRRVVTVCKETPGPGRASQVPAEPIPADRGRHGEHLRARALRARSRPRSPGGAAVGGSVGWRSGSLWPRTPAAAASSKVAAGLSALTGIKEVVTMWRELATRWRSAYDHELEQSLRVVAWPEHGEDVSGVTFRALWVLPHISGSGADSVVSVIRGAG